MDGGIREAVSSSAQLEDWAAGVAADIYEDNAEEPRTRRTGEAVTSPARQRTIIVQPPATAKRSRQQQERESSPEDDNEAKDGSRPKLPRPDKKEPCPRCNSMDTKFCYYNNYNIKQPRFYCKACQRYWTAGGTLRNIAPGSGRRKSKSKAVTREQRSGSLMADHITAATAAQSGMFGLPVNASASYPALLAAAADPTGILAGGSGSSAAAYPQLLAGHGGLSSLKLAGVSQLQGSWGNGLQADTHGNAVLREHLQAQLGVGAPMSAGLGQQGALDTRLQLLNGQQQQQQAHGNDSPRGSLALGAATGPQGPSAGHHSASVQGDASSPSGSPPPHQHQQQVSSPQQPNSQTSQQPSPPQAQHNCSASEEPDAEGIEVCVQGRRVRLKAELDPTAAGSSTGAAPGGPMALGGGLTGSSSLQNLQLASLSLPPSMASLAAVMGPGGGPSSLGVNLHPLLSQHDNGAGTLLDGPHGSLSRHHLQLALQHHQAMQQQESLQQLNGLLPHGSVTAAALHAQHPLLQGLGHPGASAVGAYSSTAAAVAALDPLQRSALLQHAAGLGGVGSWLQGGGGVSGVLPSAAITAAALESLQVQSLTAAGASGLLQAPVQSAALNTAGSGTAADWLSLAAAAAAAGQKGQGSMSASHPSAAAAVAAVHAASLGNGAMSSAAQMLQAQAAAAMSSSCGTGAGAWPGSGSFSAVSGGPPSWSLWSAYNNSASSNYAGYALQAAAAAAAYSGGR